MLRLAADNVEQCFLAFEEKNPKELERIKEREESIDLLNAKLSRRISKVLTVEHSPSEVDALRHMFTISGNIERIGDHAKNIAGYARTMMDRGLELSALALDELSSMRQSSMRAMLLLCNTEHVVSETLVKSAGAMEQAIDDNTALFRSNQIERMSNGKCHVETSILYSEILTDYERIGDHVFNIARLYAKLDQTDPQRTIV